jgi:hypothetical protein
LNKRTLGIAKWVALAALPLFIASHAHAQATRTWVSGVGDDVNPCSRTAPCKTFAGAISKTAAGGEISVLDPGGYGTVTITKAITISGEQADASILACGTTGINVIAGPADVVILRSLTINGCAGTISPGTNGITFGSGGKLHVENVKIYGFGGQGILFAPNSPSMLFVDNSSIRNAVGGAVYIKPTSSGTATAVLNGVSMVGNARGVRAEDGSVVVVRHSHASGNAANGFVALGTSRAVNMTLESCVAAGNAETGVYAGPLAMVKLSNVTITRNHDGMQAVGGGSIVSFGNNQVFDNDLNNGPPSSTQGQM